MHGRKHIKLNKLHFLVDKMYLTVVFGCDFVYFANKLVCAGDENSQLYHVQI